MTRPGVTLSIGAYPGTWSCKNSPLLCLSSSNSWLDMTPIWAAQLCKFCIKFSAQTTPCYSTMASKETSNRHLVSVWGSEWVWGKLTTKMSWFKSYSYAKRLLRQVQASHNYSKVWFWNTLRSWCLIAKIKWLVWLQICLTWLKTDWELLLMST